RLPPAPLGLAAGDLTLPVDRLLTRGDDDSASAGEVGDPVASPAAPRPVDHEADPDGEREECQPPQPQREPAQAERRREAAELVGEPVADPFEQAAVVAPLVAVLRQDLVSRLARPGRIVFGGRLVTPRRPSPEEPTAGTEQAPGGPS